MENKETGKNIMQSVALVMMIIILVLTASLIIGSLIDSSSFADTVTTGTNTNETLTNVTNLTTSSFAILSTYPNSVCLVDSVYNSTSGELLDAGNYTRDSCTIIMDSSSTYIGEDVNVTYDWTNTQSNVAGLNTTWIGIQFGLFVTALLGFLAVIGVIIAIVWLIGYIKPLFSKEDGIQTFAGN